MALTVGQDFAGYRILRKLGAGGMGEVYLAQHPRLPRQDALKVMPASMSADADFRRRFTREADLAATLDHPNIVNVYDRGEFDGQLWITMRYIKGDDVAAGLASHPHGMPANQVAQIISEVAEALDYAHSQNLLHRDVKPANILLTEIPGTGRRRAVLADFGIARPILDDAKLTATNLTVGSFAYSSPEQLAGQSVDGRADQYSLACTAYQLLSGATPFENSNAAVLIHRQLSEQAAPITARRGDLSPYADRVIARALEKDPNRRYSTCTEFAADLGTALAGAGTALAGAGVGQYSPTSFAKPYVGQQNPSFPPSHGGGSNPGQRSNPGYPSNPSYPQTGVASNPSYPQPGVASNPSYPQPGVGSNPGYIQPMTPAPPPYQPAAANLDKPVKTMATWSLVTSILSLPGSCLFGVGGIILGAVAVVLGIVALKKGTDRPAGSPTGRPMAVTGLILGIIGLLWSIVMLVAFIST